MAVVEELIAILGFDLKGEADLKRFKQGLDGAERHANNFATAFSKIGLAITGALGGLAVGAKLGDFVGDITRTNASFEKYEATLKTIEGSSEKAKASMAWIKNFGETTPYEMGELTDAFVRMRANGLDPMDGSFQTIGNTAAAMGKNFMQVVEAVADAATGEGERLKELGIQQSVAGKNVTYSWRENGKELTKTVKKNGTEMVSAVLGIWGRFDGAMLEQNKTWGGMVSNLSDRWTGFLLAIGQAGYYDDVKRRLRGLLDVVDGWATSGTMQNFAKGISDGLVGTMNTVSHLAAQAYRIGRGFYMAADGVLTLSSRITGLSKSMSAIGLGAGLLASTSFGRAAMMAVARKVPWIAAALALDDIISGLAGDDSYVGTLEGGEAALENIRQSFAEIQTAAEGFAGAMNGIFGIGAGAGSQLQALLGAFGGSFNEQVVLFLNQVADAVRDISAAITAVGDVIQNPEAAFQRFADAAIAQIDRIVAAIDGALGGALTKLGFIGADPKVQDNPNAGKITTTGQPTQAARSSPWFTPDASLTRDGMVQTEGMAGQYGVSEGNAVSAAMKVASIVSSMSTLSGMAKLALDLTGFTPQADSAKAAMADIERTYMARIDADTGPLMSKINAAKAAIAGMSANATGAAVGRSVVPQRAAVVASPAS